MYTGHDALEEMLVLRQHLYGLCPHHSLEAGRNGGLSTVVCSVYILVDVLLCVAEHLSVQVTIYASFFLCSMFSFSFKSLLGNVDFNFNNLRHYW